MNGHVSAKLVIVALLSVATIESGPCDKNRVREARKAALQIQVTIDTAIDTTNVLLDHNTITKAQGRQIALALDKTNKFNSMLIERAGAMREDTPANRSELQDILTEISAAVRDLKAANVISIKNPDGTDAYADILRALDTSIAAIEFYLAGNR